MRRVLTRRIERKRLSCEGEPWWLETRTLCAAMSSRGTCHFPYPSTALVHARRQLYSVSSVLFYSISELFDCTLKSIPPESNKREAVISVHEVVICTPTRCWDSSEELGAVVRTTTARNLFFASEAVKSTRTRLSILGTLCVQYISTTAHGANSSEINALTLGQTRVYCSLVLKLSLSYSIPPIAFQSL